MDTNNVPITLTLTSSDGGTPVTLGPFQTGTFEKTTVPVSISIPVIGHNYQITKSGPCRIWWDEIQWDFDQWPELITEATGWLKVLPNGQAAFLQGLVLPIEAGGSVPALSLLTDTGQTIGLTSTVTPSANVKTGVPYSLATPVVCHQVQIVPNGACRVWLNEIQWVAEPTPELAVTWTTQATAHGMTGYQYLDRIEISYASQGGMTFYITAQDGTSPLPFPLPSTGGQTKRVLVTLTPNKGQLFTYSAVGDGTIQIFLNDTVVWVKQWGSKGPFTPVRLVGGQFGDKASI